MAENNKKSPDNEASPIRGLFRQNEEAYNKHQREVEEENERIADERRAEEQRIFEQEQIEEVDSTAEEKTSIGGKLRAAFGKIAEIITQSEDSSLFDNDDGSFDDIFSDEAPDPPARENDMVYKIADPEPDPEPDDEDLYATETLLYSARSDDEEVTCEKNDVQETAQTETSEQAENIPAQTDTESVKVLTEETEQVPGTDNETQPDTLPEPSKPAVKLNSEGKTEITLDAIMQAKNSAAVRTPITYTGKIQFDELSQKMPDEKPQQPVQPRTNELSHDRFEEKPKLPIQPKASELSHDEPAEKAEPPVQTRTNELSHDKPAEKPKLPIQPKASELSHDEPAEKAEPPVQTRTNELSHDKPTEKPLPPIQPKANELSHDEPAEKTVPPVQTRTNELSHDDKPLVGKNHADDLPGGEGITIDEWNAAPKGKNDFSEAKQEPMVYHYNDGTPFVVMAGKFTKTLRTEYENVRRLRGYMPEAAPVQPQPQKAEDNKKAEEKQPVKKSAPAKKAAASKKPPDEKKPKEKSNVQKMPEPKPKKQFGFKIKDLFSAEGDIFDDEEEFIEEKPEIPDYGSKEDAAEIKSDINENFSKVFARTIVLSVTTVASIITALLVQIMPSLFLEIIHNGWLVYGLINFALFAVSVFAERYTIVNGLMPLRHIKGNSDTAVAVGSVAGVLQAVTALFLPNVFVDGTYHMYISLVILALLFNSIGKLLIIKRTADNFRFLCSPRAAYAGKIYTNTANASKLVSGLPAHRPIIAYTKRSKFMSNFLQLSYASDPVEDSAAFCAPFAAALSLMCGIAYGFMSNDFVGGVSSFALTAVITTPMCSLIALNIPMKNLCGSTLKKGAMISGYEAVKQFSDTNAVMIDSSQLYPKGSIILSGIKAFNESKLNNAILAGAAVTFAVDGAMSHVFETIIQDRKHMVPVVDSVTYDQGMGLSGWLGGQRVLIGNREQLQKHNIDVPDESIETKYRKMGNEIAYISMSGELIAMFILTYKADRKIAEALRELTDSGVNIIVRTIDQNITQKHIAEKFSLYPRCVKVLPTGLGNICHDEISGKEETSRAYVVTNGKIYAFAAAVAGCIGIKSTVTISKIIQILSLVIGFFLVTIISFVSGFAKLGSMEILLYTCFWCAALIIVSIVARKLS